MIVNAAHEHSTFIKIATYFIFIGENVFCHQMGYFVVECIGECTPMKPTSFFISSFLPGSILDVQTTILCMVRLYMGDLISHIMILIVNSIQNNELF